MKRILFLVDNGPARSENRWALPKAFVDAGWQVETANHDQVQLTDGDVTCDGVSIAHYTLIWPIGLGERNTFIDRWQLLSHSGARLINPASAALLLHGKLMWTDLMPCTYAAAHARDLAAHFDPQRSWVIKPAAGSFGEGVQRVERIDDIERAMQQSPGLWILQAFNPSLRDGEHRSLLVGGEVIGRYRRIPSNGLHANLAQGAVAQPAQCTDRELAIVAEVTERLAAWDVGFASIDTSGDYLVEVNVANPGGLSTLERVYEISLARELVNQVEEWLDALPPVNADLVARAMRR